MSCRHPQLFVQSEQWFRRAKAALLGMLPCDLGCHRCCIGPFAITLLDVVEIRRGLVTLPHDTRSWLEARARTQIALFESSYPRLRMQPFVDDWSDGDLDEFANRFADLPCPALARDGSCLLYPFRPLACRTMGIPIEQDGRVDGACEIQTAVPVIRLSRRAREEECQLAEQEAAELARLRQALPGSGDEVWLAYGFLPDRLPLPPALGEEEFLDSHIRGVVW